MTSTNDGAVSYAPDVFMGPLMGWCTDTCPGAEGHRLLHAILAAFAVCGLVLAMMFTRRARGRTNDMAPATSAAAPRR